MPKIGAKALSLGLRLCHQGRDFRPCERVRWDEHLLLSHREILGVHSIPQVGPFRIADEMAPVTPRSTRFLG